MENLRTKRHLLNIILNNNRLNDYASALNTARKKGYYCCGINDYFENLTNQSDTDKILVLRHDIDYVSSGTRKMYEIEKMVGVKSTFYFRDRTIDVSLMTDLINDGFEIGYHYETLANLIIEGKVKTKDDINVDVLRNEFIKELTSFEEKIGYKVKSCAGHGAPENISIGVSNNILFEDVDASSLGVNVEAYDKRIIDSFTSYISDTGIMYNYGFAYNGFNIFEAIEHGEGRICFLTHPNHWDLSLYERLKKLIRMLLGKGIYKSKINFIRIDK